MGARDHQPPTVVEATVEARAAGRARSSGPRGLARRAASVAALALGAAACADVYGFTRFSGEDLPAHADGSLQDGGADTDLATTDDAADAPPEAVAAGATCHGHTHCWTFDEPDASVSSTELALVPGGVGGSTCLRVKVDADGVADPYREALYTKIVRPGPKGGRLSMRCSLTIDSLGASDAGTPGMTVCSVDDDAQGKTFFGNVSAERDPSGATRLRIVVGAFENSNISCSVQVTNPAPWTEASFDVLWADGGATVDVALGAVANHCTGVLGTPNTVRIRPGIGGLNAGKSPPSWELRLDNFIVDVD